MTVRSLRRWKIGRRDEASRIGIQPCVEVFRVRNEREVVLAGIVERRRGSDLTVTIAAHPKTKAGGQFRSGDGGHLLLFCTAIRNYLIFPRPNQQAAGVR